MKETLKTTVLHDMHVSLGAKMSMFGGFLMPIQYEGIIKEHTAARTTAAIFDTCHMGEFRVWGKSALADLERLITSDLAAVKPGRCRNGFFCNESGGVVDDLIVYRMAQDEFMIVVNAQTQDSDFKWVTAHLSDGTKAENLSAHTAKIDLQGPSSPRILQSLVDESIRDLRPYDHRRMQLKGINVLISRTGYTGEIGFEIYTTNDACSGIWRMLMDAGAVPAGLGARDTLRLEMCYPLYGHELSDNRHAAESGFDMLLSKSKDFIGAAAVRDERRRREALTAIIFDSARAGRAGDTIHSADGAEIGVVTSGSYSPSLCRAIALGYVKKDYAIPGARVAVRAERAQLIGTVADRPMYRNGTSRRDIGDFL